MEVPRLGVAPPTAAVVAAEAVEAAAAVAVAGKQGLGGKKRPTLASRDLRGGRRTSTTTE